MSRLSLSRRLLVGALCLVAATVLFVARFVAVRRPVYLGTQPSITCSSFADTQPLGGNSLALSSDGQWLRAQYFGGRIYIWNVLKRHPRPCVLSEIQFSPNSKAMAGVRVLPLSEGRGANSFSVVTQTPEGRELWATPPRRIREHVLSLDYVGSTIRVRSTKKTYLLDARTGQFIRQTPVSGSELNWDQIEAESRRSPDGSLFYTFAPIKNERGKYQIEVWSARGHQKRWSYPARAIKLFNNAQNMYMGCIPRWENGGKALATIENDTLYLYDSQTGKLLLSQKNTLPAPLQAWAFTRDQSAVYLMDTTGKIFWQRLR